MKPTVRWRWSKQQMSWRAVYAEIGMPVFYSVPYLGAEWPMIEAQLDAMARGQSTIRLDPNAVGRP